MIRRPPDRAPATCSERTALTIQDDDMPDKTQSTAKPVKKRQTKTRRVKKTTLCRARRGDPLTAREWNKLVDAVNKLHARVDSMVATSASLR